MGVFDGQGLRWLVITVAVVFALTACGSGDEPDPISTTPLSGSSPSATIISTETTAVPATTAEAASSSSTPTASRLAATVTDPARTPSPMVNSASSTDATAEDEAQNCTYRVVNEFPHDPSAFTQGLVYRNGRLFEGTGLYGESTLREVDLETGEVLRIHALAPTLFGEGITLLDGSIYQLTWQSQTAIVYDADTFEEIERFAYTTEGWGITDDGERLYMSDGSDELAIRDPETFDEIDRIQVRDEGQPVESLNELEWIDGQLYANVWQTDTIVRIDPSTGNVTARIDLSGLLTPEDQGDLEVDVLNGIAWDAEGERLFVTGKLWPSLYEIELECG